MYRRGDVGQTADVGRVTRLDDLAKKLGVSERTVRTPTEEGRKVVSTGAWFVMFPKARVPSKEAIMSTLSTIRSAKLTDRGEMEFTVTTDGGSFDVGLNTLSFAVIEAREAVEQNRDALENADEVATYDARLELNFDHRDMARGDIFNPLLTAAERLAKLTSGVVYESNNGVFQ
jgi:hypothetical protein